MSLRIEKVGIFIDCDGPTLRRLTGHRAICEVCRRACAECQRLGLMMLGCPGAEQIIELRVEHELTRTMDGGSLRPRQRQSRPR